MRCLAESPSGNAGGRLKKLKSLVQECPRLLGQAWFYAATIWRTWWKCGESCCNPRRSNPRSPQLHCFLPLALEIARAKTRSLQELQQKHDTRNIASFHAHIKRTGTSLDMSCLQGASRNKTLRPTSREQNEVVSTMREYFPRIQLTSSTDHHRRSTKSLEGFRIPSQQVHSVRKGGFGNRKSAGTYARPCQVHRGASGGQLADPSCLRGYLSGVRNRWNSSWLLASARLTGPLVGRVREGGLGGAIF